MTLSRVRLVTYKRLAVLFGLSAGLSLLVFYRAVFGPSKALQWLIRAGWIALCAVGVLDLASYFGIGRWGRELTEAAKQDERDAP